MHVLRALALLPFVLLLACSTDGETPAVPDPVEGATNEQPAEDPPPSEDANTIEAEPAAELEGGCQTKPHVTGDGRVVLRADVRAVNTGNLGVRVRVAAFWPQPEGRGISQFQRLSLEQGESRDLRLGLVIGEEEAKAIERATSRGRKCRATLRVTGAYGVPAD